LGRQRLWPALEATGGATELMLAAVDDWSPTAVEDVEDGARIYFRSAADRNAARAALVGGGFSATPIDVPDDDWAQRSQANLEPVTVGRITIVPALPLSASPLSPCTIAVPPSSAFGTGHHASTRLCLAGLQALAVAGTRVLDVGTGSGVLALAAARLGAVTVVGIDNDPDAVDAAIANLTLNGGPAGVSFRVADLAAEPPGPRADIVLANLTGALIVREAGALVAAARPGGRLVISGVLDAERDDVAEAFPAAHIDWEAREDEWVGLVIGLP
jgi:ribosomal protein L11 methyltransferase